MKLLVVVSVFCATLAFAACGGDSSGSASSGSALTGIPGTETPPELEVPPGPPPKTLVVKDLKEGSGAVARLGRRLLVQYVSASYATGETAEVRWGDSGPFGFILGNGEVRKGWEIGLKGMKVGGRRELILPSRLAYGSGALIYIVELLGVDA